MASLKLEILAFQISLFCPDHLGLALKATIAKAASLKLFLEVLIIIVTGALELLKLIF